MAFGRAADRARRSVHRPPPDASPLVRSEMPYESEICSGGWGLERWGTGLRLKLDYGTDGLEVDLPDERVTVIEPVFRQAVPDAHEALLKALRAPIGRPPLRDIVKPGQRVAISVCDITRAQPRAETIRALLEEMPGHPRRGRHDPHRHRHAPHQHARRAGTHARGRHPRPLRRRQPRQPRRRLARARRRDEDRRAGVPEQAMARRRRADYDRLRRAALFRRLQRRTQDGRARAWRASRP